MKIINLHILLIFLTAMLYGCEETIPRNRPLSLDLGKVVDPPEPIIEPTAQELRPSGAVLIESDQCVCSANKSVSISGGACVNFCQDKSSQNNVLFFNITLSPFLTESDLIDLAGFCKTQPTDPVGSVASCSVEFKDRKGQIKPFALTVKPGQTSFSLDVSTLNKNETYRMSIVENNSQVRSSQVQIYVTSEKIIDTIGGPLGLMPVTQYACLFRQGDFDPTTGELYLTGASRFNFYFIPATRPEPLKQSSLSSVACYDVEKFGTTPINSPLFEETPGAFTVWNQNDPRFYDLGGGVPTANPTLQVHKLITQNMEVLGQTPSNDLKIFFPLEWPSGLDDGDTDPTATNAEDGTLTTLQPRLGFYMTPFMDDQTFKAYCPKREHYYSNSILFQAMREIVGVDTEALYAAKQNNVCDFLLVKESIIKKIWFYEEAGQRIQPTDKNIAGKQVQFFWPADTASPYIKKSHQRVYTIKGSNEMSCDNVTPPTATGSGSNGVRTNIPPHDKRIGCIPVLAK